jgi:hypothetical protein
MISRRSFIRRNVSLIIIASRKEDLAEKLMRTLPSPNAANTNKTTNSSKIAKHLANYHQRNIIIKRNNGRVQETASSGRVL